MREQKEIVEKVIEYIEKNLEKEINLENISKKYWLFQIPPESGFYRADRNYNL